ncbi:MAG: hypothetical protein Q7S10_01785 [bacterium]|nr:hypothetical protein [bacterium]
MTTRQTLREFFLLVLPLLMAMLTLGIQLMDASDVLLEYLTKFQILGAISTLAWITALAFAIQYKRSCCSNKLTLGAAILWVVSGAIHSTVFFALFFSS